MKKYTPFLSFWIVNSVLLWLASYLYPSYYVLGNARLSSLMAAVIAGLVWTVFVWKLMLLSKKVGIKDKEAAKMGLYCLVINFVVLWVMARFSALFGFGVARFVWVFVLAFVANLLQWGAWSLTSKK